MADYYKTHCSTYHQKTFFIDPSSFLEPLKKQLSPGAWILDIGCGSGRDLLWFKKQGFEVTGLERSPGLAELARRDTACEIIEGDFEYYDFSRHEVDAILLVASLVHVQHVKLLEVIRHVTSGLKLGGKVLVTLKQGEGVYSDDHGRIFYLWEDDALQVIFDRAGFTIIDFARQLTKLKEAEDIWLSYVLVKSSDTM